MNIYIKPLTILLISTLFCHFFGQIKPIKEANYPHYIVLDSLKNINREYSKINIYTLNAKELYGVNKKIEVYNILSNDDLLLISALPDLVTNNDWIKVDIQKIKNKILTKQDIHKFLLSRYHNNTSDKKTLEYGLVKKMNNEYYVPKSTLIEYFYIKSYKFPLIPSYGTIDISSSKVTIKEMEKSYLEQMPEQGFPLNPKYMDISFAYPVYARNYLSRTLDIKGEKSYQFWTLDNCRVADGPCVNQGIDRFIYIPKKGIVGGSYDFYFTNIPRSSQLITSARLWDNIINERIMIAEELK